MMVSISLMHQCNFVGGSGVAVHPMSHLEDRPRPLRGHHEVAGEQKGGGGGGDGNM